MIFILDPGLTDVGSHSFNYAKSILGALNRQSISFEIYCYRNVNTDVVQQINATPFFTRSLYDGETKDQISWEIESFNVLNSNFYDDLNRLPSKIYNKKNIVLLPAIGQHQVLGLCKWISEIQKEKRPRFIIQLMFYPSWTVWGAEALLGPQFYRYSLSKISSLINNGVFLCAENIETANVYEEILGKKIHILPVPSMYFNLNNNMNPNKKILNLGFLGYSKAEKGFHLLPEAISIVRGKNLPVRFLIHNYHSYWEDLTIQAEKNMPSGSDVIIYKGALDEEAYFEIFNSVDIILLPYNPEQYKTRGSSVFSEAVAYGKPIVSVKGTWMSSVSDRGECSGIIFENYNSKAFADAIIEMVDSYNYKSNEATMAAISWRESNSGDAYVDKIIQLCNESITSSDKENHKSKSKLEFSSNISRDSFNYYKYKVGDVMIFGNDEQNSRYVESEQELHESLDGIWLQSAVAHINVHANLVNGQNYKLTINGIAPDNLSHTQELEIFINGRYIGTTIIKNEHFYDVDFSLESCKKVDSQNFTISIRPSFATLSNVIKSGYASFIIKSIKIQTLTRNDYFTKIPFEKKFEINKLDNKLRLVNGWSFIEESLCWAVEAKCSIALKPEAYGKRVSVKLGIGIPEIALKDPQYIKVYIGNSCIANILVENQYCNLQFDIPDNMWSPDVPLFFDIISEKFYKPAGEERRLRFCLFYLIVSGEQYIHDNMLNDVPCLYPNKVMYFGLGNDGQMLLRNGWSNPEENRCWMSSKNADLILMSSDNLKSPVLRLGLSTLALEEDPLELNISINNRKVAKLDFNDQNYIEIEIPLLSEDTSVGKLQILSLEASKSYKVENDERDLIICMHSITLLDDEKDDA